MKIKTSELIGPTLRWVVAQIEGHPSRCAWMVQDGWAAWQNYEAAWGNPIPSYDTDWSQGGPIIEREGIELQHGRPPAYPTQWAAQVPGCQYTGPTPLTSAMRCYVASKLGDEVEVPDELK